MNWEHLRTLFWVRWRLTVNHIRRHGAFNFGVMLFLSGMALCASVVGFFGALYGANKYLPTAPTETITYVCDGWIVAFLFFWMIGVISDLQRSEMLSVDKLLHLPTTLREVYLFNFLNSLVTLTTLTFVPPMLGFAIGAVMAKGPALLVMFPLLATFVFMVCAVTYQFRGWLAALMANKRRQRSVMVAIGMTFMIVSQLPNVIMQAGFRQSRNSKDAAYEARVKRREEVRNQYRAGRISHEEYVKQDDQLRQREEDERANADQAIFASVNRVLDVVNLVLPVGWLAYGSKAAANGNSWPGLAGVIGMAAIGAFSLRRSYFTTVRYFTGEFSRTPPSKVAATAVVATPPAVTVKRDATRVNMVERSFPLVSEPVAAIAWSTLRCLTRAPEVKMMLLGPVLMLMLYGATVLPSLGGTGGVSGINRSFVQLGVLGLSIAGLAQLAHNCFGFDRSGFRSYVLSGIPRQDILIGKNLALAPLVLVLTVPILVLLQCVFPAPWTHFLAALLEIPTAYLLLSLLGNVSSIVSPICQVSGSLKPATAKGTTMLLQFLFGIATLLVLSLTAVVPLGLEMLLQYLSWLSTSVPLALICAIIELAACCMIYRYLIRKQGAMLLAREGRILEIVTEKGE